MTARRKPAADTPAPPEVAVMGIDFGEVEIFTAHVPLSQLYLHALNTRSEPPPADIEALAESIRAIGLLQNLSGFQDTTADPGRIGIVASLVTPNVRAIWTPTKDSYLARLPVPVLDAIWSDLVPRAKAPHRAWDELKKAQKAAELHDLFNSADYREALGLSRDEAARIDAWTPPELQWPEVEAGEG